MVHKKIRIPREAAIDVMNEIGKLEEATEFIDLNKDDLEAKKNFGGMIKRCDEVEKRINNFEKITESYNEKMCKYSSYQKFNEDLDRELAHRGKSLGSAFIDLLENEVFEDDKKLSDLLESYNKISDNLEGLIEKKSVFDKISHLLTANDDQSANIRASLSNIPQGGHMIDQEQSNVSGLNFMAGVIKAEDDLRMKRMIFRISRGRAVPTFFDLSTEKKFSKTKIQKKIFTIFFQGGIENVMLGKLLKVCDIFGASRFNIPRKEDLNGQINQLQKDIIDKKSFLKEAETSIRDFIHDRSGSQEENAPGRYELFRIFFKKERLIYTNLNKCKVRGNFLDGEVWIPEESFDKVLEGINQVSKNNPSKLTASFYFPDYVDSSPPTYIKTNDLTYPFQEIVDTYGVPRYQEVNPALFTIVTFPFLFGVMFGDIGHGGLLLLFGSYLVWKNDDLERQNSVLKPALKARYLLFFMGIFAFYCGWMYNDFLSVPLGIFGSCYHNVEGEGKPKAERINQNCVYPVGLDPKWYVASNELAFINSLKMKLSVILGVLQMSFGIVLKAFNAVHFKSNLDLIFEFIPQIIFMSFLFGYMIILIFIKWATDWTADTSKAPSIITQLMMIFLQGGSVGDENKKLPLWGRDDYNKQENLHFWIVIICAICVPMMLFPKPILVYLNQGKQQQSRAQSRTNEEFNEVEGVVLEKDDLHSDKHRGSGVQHHAEHDFGEIFVHQAIETIEFVLGAISNTASYLRLWALSLAHAQLAKVFFTKALLGFIQEGQIVLIVIGFFIFANVTFFVLMCMDLMECFLHTLRLHWVEFQNKFYKADGYKFKAFCFKYLVEPKE